MKQKFRETSDVEVDWKKSVSTALETKAKT
jgi:hypothetical protein